MKTALSILITLLTLSIILPLLYINPNNSSASFIPPSTHHPFGTNGLGKDLLVACCTGFKYSILVSVLSSIINTFIGTLVGITAALSHPVVDQMILKTCDFLQTLPKLIIIMILSMFLPQGIVGLLFLLCVMGWISTARIVRAQVHKIKQLPFVLSSKGLGASSLWIGAHHCWPNCRSLILSTLFLSIPRILSSEAFISFLGKGLAPPSTTLGHLCVEGLPLIEYYPWVAGVPSLILFITLTSFHIIGYHLREHLDKRCYV